MTREERIKLIRHLKYKRSVGADYLITDKDIDEIIKALELIQALGQESIFDKMRTEIEALTKTYPFVNHIDAYVKEDDVKKIIDKYKAEIEVKE